jgi:formate hydrogenlyase subunit 3/multisubunit Na+/H+ antiporter MnhD subunit
MSFAVVLEGMTIAAFTILLVGGKQKREQGWGVLTILVALAAFVQAIGMALMVRTLGSSWVLTKADISRRLICMKTTSDSSPAGFLTRAGRCARCHGVFRRCALLQSRWLL